ncbi:Tn3 family transposase [Streptomyces sp. CA-251387]|uniref:Tn3 family transposase n=1 Tax=Streptomyces sp. CA-251387 TaxID=3240064 RepID=UPI003D8D6395
MTRLLNVDLLPRIKQINKVKLYRPTGEPGAYPNLKTALTRPIRWDVIAANYDQVITYATAIRTGTASAEAILSRFTRAASHPAYQAMLEIGRAQKTSFVARDLRSCDLQREIEESLNVVEAWNRANGIIYHPARRDLHQPSRGSRDGRPVPADHPGLPGLREHSLMLQTVLTEPRWSALLTAADRRGLTPLFWEHVRPYGDVRLDLGSLLDLGGAGAPVG